MSFASPEWLWGLAALPLLIVSLWLLERHRRRRLGRLAVPRAIDRIRLAVPAPHLIKGALIVVASGLVLTSLARPRWGESEEEIETRGLDLVIALDLSRSMLAEDVAPSRLIIARDIARTLADHLLSDRVGLIGFAGHAATLCPLTLDRAALELYLESADPSIFPAQGTDLAAAVSAARGLFERRGLARRILVVLSDGEDQEESGSRAIDVAREAEIRVYAIGIGTRDGAPIPIRDDRGRVRSYHESADVGRVTTQLEEATLRALAERSGGAYVRASGHRRDVEQIVAEIERLERDELSGVRRSRHAERYRWPLGAALLLAVIEAGLVGRRTRVSA